MAATGAHSADTVAEVDSIDAASSLHGTVVDGESYGVTTGLPTSVVLGPDGRIVEVFRGPQSEAKLRRALLEAA